MPEPLRKRKLDGSLYVRPPELETLLTQLSLLPLTEIVERAQIHDPKSPNYLPSECLLYFLRRARDQKEIDSFQELFLVVRQRIIATTPALERKASGTSKSGAKAADVEIQESLLDSFNEMLCRDRSDYDDRLDYYEIRFNDALCALRISSQRRVRTRESRTEALTGDENSNFPSPEVEAALMKLRSIEGDENLAVDYRLDLEAAINTLSADELRVIELLMQGFQIDSDDPDVMTIAKELNCAEKTVRNRRDRAYQKLRAVLEREQGHE